MSIFCDEQYQTLCAALNYTFGILFPVVFILSLTLNPLVFFYNCKQKPSTATTLFQMLSVIDFLTTTYQPLVVTIQLLNKEHCQGQLLRSPTTLELASTIFMAPIMQTAGMITTLMSVTRYIQIRSPFYPIKRAALVIYSVIYISFLLSSYSFVLLTADHAIFDPYIQYAWHVVPGRDWWALGLTLPYTLHCLLAAATSVLTVRTLWGHDDKCGAARSQRHNIASQKRGSITVLIMNIGNLTMFAFSLVYLALKVRTKEPTFGFQFIKFFTWCFLPISLSALNPLVIVTRSTGFRRSWTAIDSAFDLNPGSKGRTQARVHCIENRPVVMGMNQGLASETVVTMATSRTTESIANVIVPDIDQQF